jgi:stage V sporulation protein R
MIGVSKIPVLQNLKERVLHYATEKFGMTLPEMRFFNLDNEEFMSLLEKGVFPNSPVNIWEGKEVINRRIRVEHGLEPGTIYEVVQPGDPAYVYLNDGNEDVMQASVMAHVCGHCEFAELTVLNASEKDLTEKILFLAKKVEEARQRMGHDAYIEYWNRAESLSGFVRPISQFSLENSIDHDRFAHSEVAAEEPKKQGFRYHSNSLSNLIHNEAVVNSLSEEKQEKKRQRNELDQKGYRLKAPCEDVFGFVMNYAPTSVYQRRILEYLYETNRQSEKIMRTQIMDEGWCMYWEKKIMLELFKEKAVGGIIEHLKVMAAVCHPRPYFQRNPYHLGYYLWKHVEEMHKKGKISSSYLDEKDREAKEEWDKAPERDTVEFMRHLVKTITDHEFLRRFLSPEMVEECYLNRIPIAYAMSIEAAFPAEAIVKQDDHWIWIDPETIRNVMLSRFENFGRPRIYVIDDNYNNEGGLLLYHRNDRLGPLRKNWINATLTSINCLWQRPVHLLAYEGDGAPEPGDDTPIEGVLYSLDDKVTRNLRYPSFEEVRQNIMNGHKPL